jgi:cytochrome c oxidase assembly factor CtaG
MTIRLASMALGVVLLFAAMVPPDRIDGSRPLAVHMAELVLVVYVAAPLLAWPAPLLAGRWTLPRVAGVWCALAVAQPAIHLPAALIPELHHGAVHGLVQAGMLALAVLCWSGIAAWPAERSPAGPIAILLASIPAGDALSLWLLGATHPIAGGISTGDQRAAAAMMFTASIVLGLAALAVGARAARREHAQQLLRERTEARHA